LNFIGKMKFSKTTKKRFAKEFLFLAILLIISVSSYLIAIAYDYTLEKNYNNLESSYESKSFELEEIYNNDDEIFYPEERQKILWEKLLDQSLYTRSLEQFKVQYSDSISRQKMHEIMLEEGHTDKSLEDFFSSYFPHINQSILTEPSASELNIINQERKLKNEIRELSTSIEEKKLKLKDKNYYSYATSTTIITFMILFPIRYFFLAIKWSIRILKS